MYIIYVIYTYDYYFILNIMGCCWGASVLVVVPIVDGLMPTPGGKQEEELNSGDMVRLMIYILHDFTYTNMYQNHRKYGIELIAWKAAERASRPMLCSACRCMDPLCCALHVGIAR